MSANKPPSGSMSASASLLLSPASSPAYSWTVLVPVPTQTSQPAQMDGAPPPEAPAPDGPSRGDPQEVSPVSQLQKPLRAVTSTSQQQFGAVHDSSAMMQHTTHSQPTGIPSTSVPQYHHHQHHHHQEVPVEGPPTIPSYPSVGSGDAMKPPPGSYPGQPMFSPTEVGYAQHPSPAIEYHPVPAHWFYKKTIEKKEVWIPFSKLDSSTLEKAYQSGLPDAVVPTDGGRYDVYLSERKRKPVYWNEDPSDVQRCTWFYKAEGQQKFLPYSESMANEIEEHYRVAVTMNRWQQRINISKTDSIIIHSPNTIVHFQPWSQPDEWGNVNEGQLKPHVVRRGFDDLDSVEEGEPQQIDHLIFVVHGVGAICDLRFRTIVECVDDIRSLALSMQQTHFKQHVEMGAIGRVEFLPVSWHGPLHSGTTGIDRRIKPITLGSIPKLRHFINDTLLDILFYTSPVYCQTIVDTVGSEINRLYSIFTSRNPNFGGRVSLAGHSLGSLILFDILGHQIDPANEQALELSASAPECPAQGSKNGNTEEEASVEGKDEVEQLFRRLSLDEYLGKVQDEKIDMETLLSCEEADLKELGLPMGPRKKLLTYLKDKAKKASLETDSVPSDAQTMTTPGKDSLTEAQGFLGPAGTGQPFVTYPRLSFSPCCFFALGSPIAMFLTIRGIKTLGEDYKLPTCPSFFNIFHPFDPVAYRIETLIDPTLSAKPVVIPHHKGRKRMHLELKESLSRVGSDLKQKLIDSLRYTWNSLNEFARAHRFSAAQVEEEMQRVVEEELKNQNDNGEESDTPSTTAAEEDIRVGQLNGGRRIDYSLQEKPIESFNEYLFALGSHACYWESEDTVLMILKEVYAVQGVHPSRNYVQLYNPSIRPSYSMPAFPPSAAIPQPPFAQPEQFVQVSSAPEISMAAAAMPSAPPPLLQHQNQGPLAPPPLTGFVRVSPLQQQRR